MNYFCSASSITAVIAVSKMIIRLIRSPCWRLRVVLDIISRVSPAGVVRPRTAVRRVAARAVPDVQLVVAPSPLSTFATLWESMRASPEAVPVRFSIPNRTSEPTLVAKPVVEVALTATEVAASWG